MNRMHQRICASAAWAEDMRTRIPERLAGVDLGDDVLELGPGYGATTHILAGLTPKLTAVEIDRASADALTAQFAGQVRIVHGSATDLPFDDDSFSAVVCFTMLHHVPTAAAQDEVFAQACRVLRPGGVFAGSDGQPSLRFRVVHLGDTMTTVDPRTFPDRLARAGFVDVRVQHVPRKLLTFSARKPERG